MNIFSKKVSVLYISRTRIRAVSVFLGKGNHVESVLDAEWTPESLDLFLQDARTRIGIDARIVLADDLSYVVSLPFPKGVALSRDAIRNEAQGLIPENMEKVAWDFGVSEEKTLSGISGSLRIVQAMAASEIFSDTVVPSLVQAGFVIDALEAEACALARLVDSGRDPLLLVYDERDGSHLLLVLDHGVVMVTERIIGPLSVDDIEKTLLFAKSRYDKDVRNILFSGEGYDGILEEMRKKRFKVGTDSIDPCIGIALKKDLEGSDQDVLNMDLLPRKTEANRVRRSEKRLLKIFIVVLLCGAVAVSGILMYRKKSAVSKHDVRIEVSETIALPQGIDDAVSDSLTVSEDAKDVDPVVSADISSYRVSILNGGGERGAAGKLGDVLEKSGFTVAAIGNARESSTETFVRVKASVSEEVRKALIGMVEPIYIVSREIQVLDDSNDSDIVITIGSEKANSETKNVSIEAVQHD